MAGRIVLPGGSGFLGQALARYFLGKGKEVVVLTRSPAREGEVGRFVQWDAKSIGPWAETLEGAEAVINLTGKSVNCRHTEENKRLIISSRVDSTLAVGAAIQGLRNPPPVWLQASSLAIYGNAGDRLCDESAPFGNDFSADVCKQWEAALAKHETPATRRIAMRIGIVLDNKAGALPYFARLVKLFLGGHTGSGRQYISWIHVEDYLSLVDWLLETESASGPLNVCAPHPSTHKDFMSELRHVFHRPWSPPIPAWAVRIGAPLIGTDADLPLTGRRGIPKAALDAGFEFRHTNLREALADLCSKTRA
jgi:uncharacterized protein (TIGR01777 family)